MRYIYILLLFSMFGYSQTNEAVINQAVQQAEAQNITTPSQAEQALKASGMTGATGPGNGTPAAKKLNDKKFLPLMHIPQ